MANKTKLSLIIPAYNEENIIKNTLEQIIKFLSEKRYEWEVIVVDDGSHDQTAKIADKFNKKKVEVIRYDINRGKGGALKEGIQKAKGDFIIFSDADLSVDISKVDEMLYALKNSDVVIG